MLCYMAKLLCVLMTVLPFVLLSCNLCCAGLSHLVIYFACGISSIIIYIKEDVTVCLLFIKYCFSFSYFIQRKRVILV